MRPERALRAGGDLPNARLAAIVALALLAGVFLAALAPSLPAPWGRPGGPLLQAAAALGSLLLLASFAAVLAKRFGRSGKTGFRRHVWLASVGAAMVFAHAASNVTRPAGFLLALLFALILLGVWSRTAGARRMAATFGEKRRAFAGPDAANRARLAEIVQAKRALLARLDAAADEGVFSPGPRHWLRAPLATFAYARLAGTEARLMAARAEISPAQAWWRLGHRLLAWAFVAGLVLHIVIVMWFAGYVADGGEVYWLHFAAWDF